MNVSLEGTIKYGNTRSVSTVEPIEAYLTDLGIEAYFNKSLGFITITISNESEVVVFQTVIDSDSEDNWSIPMTDFAAGTYTINFSCDYGQKTGTFYW